ncbi:MAG: iron ABC transporter substrate-binding protein [Hyphomicrobiaceae bacterium]|nr:iron ABC transporter substrate-binding protein [Hyphomicrobiaceae bacterium]
MRLVLLLLALLMAQPVMAGTITDSAGRTVEVPDKITRLYASGPPAAVIVYALAPDMLIGWPRAFTEAELAYIPEAFRGLPEVGRLTGRGGTANLEVVIREKPDLIVDFGSLRDTYISLANRVQAQTGIPNVLIDGRFEATPAALRLLGKTLGRYEIAEIQARYAERLFAQVDEILKDVPVEKRPRVYLARRADGLESGAIGSINTEILERAGGKNIVGEVPGRRGLVQMTMEKILLANPEVIVTWDRNFYDTVRTDPVWAKVDAVKNSRVYLSPAKPFGWIDRPPSVNRLMGLRWMVHLLYPQLFPMDLKEETRRFYELFYHVTLSDEGIDKLLGPAAEYR